MVVVTGATGHIGNVLVRQLIEYNVDVRALVLPGDNLRALDSLPVEIAWGDVTDYASLLNAFSEAAMVYHLAGVVSIGSGRRKLLHSVNVEGTKNVVKACIEKGVKRLVYTSSIHAFEELPHDQELTETKSFDEKKVRGAYAKTKSIATQYVLDAARNGLDVIVVHPTGIIGPHQFSLSNMGQMVIDFMSKRLYAYIDGSYDFVDVRDVAHGIILAGEKGRRGENYILSGEQITVKRILEHLEAATGLKAPRIKIPLWFARLIAPLSELYYKILRQQPLYTSYSIQVLQSNSISSYQKANKELGYSPRPIQDSFTDMVEWLKHHYA